MASPHSLVPQGSALRLPIARMRSVFQPGEVERKLAKLPERKHESLRSTYARMLERFLVKPAGVPDMSSLYDDLPNFTGVLDALAELAPRVMPRALMTGFGNARLAERDALMADDLPRAGSGKPRAGFLQ